MFINQNKNIHNSYHNIKFESRVFLYLQYMLILKLSSNYFNYVIIFRKMNLVIQRFVFKLWTYAFLKQKKKHFYWKADVHNYIKGEHVMYDLGYNGQYT